MSTSRPRNRLFRLLAAAAVAFAVTLAVVWLAMTSGEPTAGVGRSGAAPFQLTDQDGQSFDSQSLRGRVALIFFGFTHCPDICPTTMAVMSNVLGALGPEADQVRAVFVSVDPERDTPAALKTFGSIFDPRISMLTGTREKIDRVIADYHVYARRVPADGPDYTIDHTASIFLLRRDGGLMGLIDFHDSEDKIIAKVRDALR